MKAVLRHPAQTALAARDAITKDACAFAERHPALVATLLLSAEMLASIAIAGMTLYALAHSSK
jgi:hypothetical protein